jgi:hypothetical protein
MTVRLPWIKWRDGRPRLANSARERAMGFADRDLRHPPFDAEGRPIGAWFTYEEAKAVSDEHQRKIVEARASGRKVKPVQARKRVTVADLLEDWKGSDEFKGLSPASRISYEKGISGILYRPQTRQQAAEHRARAKAAKLLGLPAPARELEEIAKATPRALGKPELRAVYNYWKTTRGHHMALALVATLSAALTWGQESVTWRLGPNPRIGMEFERPDGRVVLVTMQEFAAWVAAVDALGRWSIGDSFYLGLFTGQRQTDRLAMRDESQEDGRHAFRQSKTGELVDIKEAPQLNTRLEAARARVAAITLRLGLRERPSEIVVNEDSGKAYDDNTYRHWVAAGRDVAVFGWREGDDRHQALRRAQDLAAELRKAEAKLFAAFPITEEMEKAARGRAIEGRAGALRAWLAARAAEADKAGWKLKPCPSLLFVNASGEVDAKHDQDLRDTCVMLLDRAGCDLLTICDITGHSYKSAQTIVKHYRARNPDRADAGIDRLVLQVRKEGMAG